MILPTLEGKLCLKKQIIADHQSAFNCFRNGLPDGLFVVMPPLVRCIDSTKSLSQR
jgi:hypothetical protein